MCDLVDIAMLLFLAWTAEFLWNSLANRLSPCLSVLGRSRFAVLDAKSWWKLMTIICCLLVIRKGF